LVLMERKMNMATKADDHVAHVVKDRSTLLDGKEFADPTFKDFLPHITCLNLEVDIPPAMSIDTSRTSAAAIPADAPRDRSRMQRDILVEEINDLLMRHDAAGTAKEAQKKRSELLERHLGTVSKTKIEELISLSDLKAGFDSMHIELEGKPSRYNSAIVKDNQPLDINDSLPDHSAPNTADTFATLVAATGASLTKVDKMDTETLAANGMPKFLVRVPEVVPEPEPPAFDEAAWLAELTKAFKHCIDFVAFSEQQQTLMAPNRAKVSAASWKKAVKLASACMTQLIDNPESAPALAVAAE
jgi:hypothetical protein